MAGLVHGDSENLVFVGWGWMAVVEFVGVGCIGREREGLCENM